VEENRKPGASSEAADKVIQALRKLHRAEDEHYTRRVRVWGRIGLVVAGSLTLPVAAGLLYLFLASVGVAPVRNGGIEGADRLADFTLFVVLPASGLFVGVVIGFLGGPRSRLLAMSVAVPWIVISSFIPVWMGSSNITGKELAAHGFLVLVLAGGSSLGMLFQRGWIAYTSTRDELL
jgi:hypothetical protein